MGGFRKCLDKTVITLKHIALLAYIVNGTALYNVHVREYVFIEKDHAPVKLMHVICGEK